MTTHTMTIREANRASGISAPRLRNMMKRGELKGYISEQRKVYRPLRFSLFHEVLGYPPSEKRFQHGGTTKSNRFDAENYPVC